MLHRGRITAGPRFDLPKPRDVGEQRRTPGAHGHRVAGDEDRVDPVVVGDDDPLLPVQARVAADEVDLGLLKPLHLRIVVPLVGDAVAAAQHRGDVELSGHRLLRAVHRLRSPQRRGAAQQRLGRHARPVRALAADQLLLDDDRRQAPLYRAVGDVLAHRPGTDDHDVVLAGDLHGPDPNAVRPPAGRVAAAPARHVLPPRARRLPPPPRCALARSAEREPHVRRRIAPPSQNSERILRRRRHSATQEQREGDWEGVDRGTKPL